MDALELLKQTSLFSRLPAPYLADLARIAVREEHPVGERLVIQGDLGNRFFIVDRGLVNLRQTDPLGVERSVGVVPAPPSAQSKKAPPRYFGEQMFTTQDLFAFHAFVVRPTVVYVFSRQDYDRLVERQPKLPKMLGFVRLAEKRRTRGYDWIKDDEIVELVEHKHWWAFMPGLVPVAVFAVLAAVALFILHFMVASELLLWAAGGLAALLVVLGTYQAYDWRNDDYVVTNQRVVHLERVPLGRALRDIVPLNKVLGTTVVRSFPAAQFGCTTVVIRTAGREQGNVTFEFVAEGEKIRQAIESARERVRAKQLAVEQDLLRQNVREGLLQHFAGQAAPESELKPPAPATRPAVRKTLQGLVASWLNLELVEPGRKTWRKHWIVLVKQTLKWFVGLLVVFGCALLFYLNSGIRFPGYWLGGLVLLAIFLAGLLYQWEDWRNDYYAVTDNQVIDIESLPFGLMSKSTTAPLDQVQDVRVEIPSGLALMLNYGNVKIETAGQNGQMIFYSIHNPRSAQEEIFRRLEAYRARRVKQQSAVQSRALLDALDAYDRLKQNQAQQQSSPPDSSTPAPGGGPA